jgi:hypothetical protein
MGAQGCGDLRSQFEESPDRVCHDFVLLVQGLYTDIYDVRVCEPAHFRSRNERTRPAFFGTMVRWARLAVLVPPRHRQRSMVDDCKEICQQGICSERSGRSRTDCLRSSSSMCRALTFHFETVSMNACVCGAECGIGNSCPGAK